MACVSRILLLAALYCALPGSAQQSPAPDGKITVQVLDGKTGKPISSETVTLDCLAGKDGCPGFEEYTIYKSAPGKEGQINLKLPRSASTLIVDQISDEYEDCALSSPRSSWYDVSAIQNTGILGKNDCGNPSEKTLKQWQPQPGRLVVFLHRKPWWVRIFPYC